MRRHKAPEGLQTETPIERARDQMEQRRRNGRQPAIPERCVPPRGFVSCTREARSQSTPPIMLRTYVAKSVARRTSSRQGTPGGVSGVGSVAAGTDAGSLGAGPTVGIAAGAAGAAAIGVKD